jgi:hypothetical protein
MTHWLWLTALTPIAGVLIHELSGIIYLRFLRQYYTALQVGGTTVEPDQLAGLVTAFFKPRAGRWRRSTPRDTSREFQQDGPPKKEGQ